MARIGIYVVAGLVALEQIGINAKPYIEAIRTARNSPYEFTRRIATRLAETLSGK